MSCIAGILAFDGSLADPALLRAMVDAMKARAPDGFSTFSEGSFGLALAYSARNDRIPATSQFCNRQNELYVTCDARIDDRNTLIDKLNSRGERHIGISSSPAELLLSAYQAYGRDLVDHLIGDYSFIIWDGRKRKLLCGKDHFGIRPLYYTANRRRILIASDIQALLMDPGVCRNLNERALNDYLLFGNYYDEEDTIYRDICRLPGGHILEVDPKGNLQCRKYWQLSIPYSAEIRKPESYIEELGYLLDCAVHDRMDSTDVLIEMSGGMDSTTIAACARKQSLLQDTRLAAITTVTRSLVPDDGEEYYSGLVGAFLNIPINYIDTCEYNLFQASSIETTPQPYPLQNLAQQDFSLSYAQKSGYRVILTGFMADAFFACEPDYYLTPFRRGHFGKGLHELFAHMKATGNLRNTGFKRLLRKRTESTILDDLPPWISRRKTGTSSLEDRWHTVWSRYLDGRGSYQLTATNLGHSFDKCCLMPFPVDFAFPFMDLRLVRFFLSTPNYLKFGKRIMRSAMEGKLPAEVLRRPKEGPLEDLTAAKLAAGKTDMEVNSLPILSAQGLVDEKSFLACYNDLKSGENRDSTFWSHFIMQTIALEHWLSHHDSDYP